MATSSFSKNFTVSKEKENEFVEEMLNEALPTLEPNFNSRLICLDSKSQLKNVFNQIFEIKKKK